jgi:hypothetical protein
MRRSGVHRSNPYLFLNWLSVEKRISFSDMQPLKPDYSITPTNEEILIRKGDVHPQNPSIFLN